MSEEKTPADLVAEYISLRNSKDAAKKKFDEWMKTNIGDRMVELEAILLSRLNDLGVDSIATKGVGTVYKKFNTSVTVSDASEFRRHVIGLEAWELIDWRANKTAIEELVSNDEMLPPGISRSGHYTVGIRKS